MATADGLTRLAHGPIEGRYFDGIDWTDLSGEAPDLTDPGTQGAVLFGILVPAGWEFTLVGGYDPPRAGLAFKGRPPFGAPIPEALARALQATP
jgi:hypothetical protein